MFNTKSSKGKGHLVAKACVVGALAVVPLAVVAVPANASPAPGIVQVDRDRHHNHHGDRDRNHNDDFYRFRLDNNPYCFLLFQQGNWHLFNAVCR